MRASNGGSDGRNGGRYERIDLVIGDLVRAGGFVGLGMEHSSVPQGHYRLVATRRETLAFLGSFVSVSILVSPQLDCAGRLCASASYQPGRVSETTIDIQNGYVAQEVERRVSPD